MPDLRSVVAALDARYEPAWAEPWDAVGLVCGDPDMEIRRVLFALDPVAVVVDEAVSAGANLVVAHHPLFLRGVHGVAATTPKGRLVHRLVTAGVALFVAHTNADVADPGVSDALATVLGLEDLHPLRPAPADPLDKVVVFVPHTGAEPLIDALSAAGAGQLGRYDRCAWTATGIGTFRPQQGARPAIGTVGSAEMVPETRVEMVLPRAARGAVVAALRAMHPYEEPAFEVLELALPPGRRGLGRVGRLAAPEPIEAFIRRVARALPATAGGVRSTANVGSVQLVGVCGGAGDDLIGEARASGADVFVSADLRHHPASEAAETGGLALLDAPHWATEWPWLPVAAADLAGDLGGRMVTTSAGGASPDTVEVLVSTRVTDPWALHLQSATAAEPPSLSRRP